MSGRAAQRILFLYAVHAAACRLVCNFAPFERESVAVRRPPPTLEGTRFSVGGGLRTATCLAPEVTTSDMSDRTTGEGQAGLL